MLGDDMHAFDCEIAKIFRRLIKISKKIAKYFLIKYFPIKWLMNEYGKLNMLLIETMT